MYPTGLLMNETPWFVESSFLHMMVLFTPRTTVTVAGSKSREEFVAAPEGMITRTTPGAIWVLVRVVNPIVVVVVSRLEAEVEVSV
jgi:hypothetical protein